MNDSVRFVLLMTLMAFPPLVQNSYAADADSIRMVPGLVAFWDFQEEAGRDRVSGEYALKENNGPIETVQGGVFGPRSALIRRCQWLAIERSELRRLNVHGKDAEVTVIAWIYPESTKPWQAIAGVWGETRQKRQYCLFLGATTATRADEMKRYPVANRIPGSFATRFRIPKESLTVAATAKRSQSGR